MFPSCKIKHGQLSLYVESAPIATKFVMLTEFTLGFVRSDAELKSGGRISTLQGNRKISTQLHASSVLIYNVHLPHVPWKHNCPK